MLCNPHCSPPWFNLPNVPFIIPFVKWEVTSSPAVLRQPFAKYLTIKMPYICVQTLKSALKHVSWSTIFKVNQLNQGSPIPNVYVETSLHIKTARTQEPTALTLSLVCSRTVWFARCICRFQVLPQSESDSAALGWGRQPVNQHPGGSDAGVPQIAD